MRRPEDFGTETATRHGDLSRTPQRVAKRQAKEYQTMAANIREFVKNGKVETWKPEMRSQRGKLISKEGARYEGITVEQGRKLIAEAERLELLASVTLEGIGINDECKTYLSKA
jgi:hypothetical protein